MKVERYFLPCLFAMTLGSLAARAGDCACKPLSVTVRAADAVSVKNFTFIADPLMINVGDTVTWTNNDTSPHTATSDAPLFDTGVLNTGDSKSFTFTAAGSVPYHCSIHSFMKGTIVVQGSAGPTPPALTNLTATATVGAAFNYTITATGTAPITFSATLPQGFTLTGAAISGTFTAAGTVSIPLTATNSAGTDNKNLVVTVSSGSGGGGATGNWSGSLKGKIFDQTGAAKPSVAEGSPLTFVFTQNDSQLAAQLTSGSATISLNGHITAGQFWLSGFDGDRLLVFSGHVDKKVQSAKGEGVAVSPRNSEEFTFTIKKH